MASQPSFKHEVKGCRDCPLAAELLVSWDWQEIDIICQHPEGEGRVIEHTCDREELPETAPEFCPLRSIGLRIVLEINENDVPR